MTVDLLGGVVTRECLRLEEVLRVQLTLLVHLNHRDHCFALLSEYVEALLLTMLPVKLSE